MIGLKIIFINQPKKIYLKKHLLVLDHQKKDISAPLHRIVHLKLIFF